MNDIEKNKFITKTKKAAYPKAQTSINLVEQIRQPIELKIKKFDSINRNYFIKEVDSINFNKNEENNATNMNKNFSFFNEATFIYNPEKGKKTLQSKKIPEFFIKPVNLLNPADSSLEAFSTKTYTNFSNSTNESTLFFNPAKAKKNINKRQIPEFYLKSFNVSNMPDSSNEVITTNTNKHFSNSNEATIFYNQVKNNKSTKTKQIPEFFIKPTKDTNAPISTNSTNSSKLSFTSESNENNHNELSVKKSNKNTVHVVNTLERTNTNVYFWYYKNNECQRNSCKIKIRFPKLNKDNNGKNSEELREHKKERRVEQENSSPIGCMSPNQKHLTESMKFFLEEKSVIASSLNSGLSPSRVEFYKSEQEKLNNKNFILDQKSSLSNESHKTTSETLDDLFYDFDTPMPDVDKVKKTKTRTNLTVAELKSLSVSDKFIEEAKRMVFIPEANAFHPKFRYYYKKD